MEGLDAGAQDFWPECPSTLRGLERAEQGDEGGGTPNFPESDSRKFVRLGRCPMPSRGDCCCPCRDALPINACHDREGEVESAFEIPRGDEVDLAGKIRDLR